MLVLNADLPLNFSFSPLCCKQRMFLVCLWDFFPPHLLLHFPRYLVAGQSSHIPKLYSKKKVIGTNRGYQTVSLQSGWAERLQRIRNASVLSYPSSRIWENKTTWKNLRFFWHYQSGQPRCLKQKSYLLLHLRLHGERNCILWGNKTWISGSSPYFHPADKWLLLCPHLKMNKTSVLVWRQKQQVLSPCDWGSRFVHVLQGGTSSPSIKISAVMLRSQSVFCSARRLKMPSNLWSG